MMPDSEDPQPPNPEPEAHQTTVPTEVSEDEYHEHADRYMNTLNERAEALQESREDVEVEYSVRLASYTIQLSHPSFGVHQTDLYMMSRPE